LLKHAVSSDVRSQILRTTLAVIAGDGMRAVTHRRIAEDTGVAVGLITYYFSSTPALLESALQAVIAQEIERYEARAAELAASEPDRAALARFLVDEVLQWTEPARRRNAGAIWALTMDRSADPGRQEAYARWAEASRETFTRVAALAGAEDPAIDGALLEATIVGLSFDATLAPELDRHLVREVIDRQLDRIGA
jgi:DNA-binding transcriptional regulator YbjK